MTRHVAALGGARVDTSTPVVVLKLVDQLFPYGSLGIVRSLGRLGVPVHVVHGREGCLDGRSRYARGGWVWNLTGPPGDRTLQDLTRIAGEIGRSPILMPTDDVAAMFVDDNAEVLRECFILPLRPADLARRLSNKWEMSAMAREAGVPTPLVWLPNSRDEAAAMARNVRFPVVLKSVDPLLLRFRSGGKSVAMARDMVEFLAAYDDMQVIGERNVLIQEYIPGSSDTIWIFNGYFDNRSDCPFGLTGQKIRQYPPSGGVASLAVCRGNEAIDRLTRRLMKAVGYRGILDIGYRFDARDGEYKLLDVNPRIGATFRCFVSANGLDVARALYLDLTGQRVPSTTQPQGRRWAVENFDAASSFRQIRAGELRPGSWLKAFGGIDETAWFAADDLGPFIGMCSMTAREAGARLRTGRGRSPASSSLSQTGVAGYFSDRTEHWSGVYDAPTVQGVIYREREARAASWLESAGLPPGATVLEVGTGAGRLGVRLARRGHRVLALDSSDAMVALARPRARDEGLSDDSIRVSVGDVHSLDLPSEHFHAVVALGVLPWLHSPQVALAEMARTLRPGGLLVVTSNNRSSLIYLLDPWLNPIVVPLKRFARARLERLRLLRPAGMHPRYDRIGEVDRLLETAGLAKIRGETVGFGPFTVGRRPVSPDGMGTRLHGTLQRLADRGIPPFRATGAHYLVMGRKAPPHGDTG